MIETDKMPMGGKLSAADITPEARNFWYGEKRTPIDLARIKGIIDKVGYRGFTPVEALGEGDPKAVVTAFLERVRRAFA